MLVYMVSFHAKSLSLRCNVHNLNHQEVLIFFFVLHCIAFSFQPSIVHHRFFLCFSPPPLFPSIDSNLRFTCHAWMIYCGCFQSRIVDFRLSVFYGLSQMTCNVYDKRRQICLLYTISPRSFQFFDFLSFSLSCSLVPGWEILLCM